MTDPVATGARSPRTASPSTTRGRIRPPRPRRLGPLPCAPLTPLLSSVAHSPLGSPQIPFPPPPRRGRRRASPVPAATEPRSPHRRVPRLRQRRLLRLHPRTGVGELHNARIEPPPSASAAIDPLQLRPPSAAPNLSPAFLSHSVSSSPSPFSHVGRPLLKPARRNRRSSPSPCSITVVATAAVAPVRALHRAPGVPRSPASPSSRPLVPPSPFLT